ATMTKLRPCRYGPMQFLANDTVVGRSLDQYGEYSEAEVALFRRLVAPGQVVLDVGANVGAHTVPLAQCVGPAGRVLAFEPQRQAFDCLETNRTLNQLANVEAHHAAVSNAAGTVLVPELDPAVEQNRGALELGRPHPDARGEQVPVLRLDDLA